MKKQLVLFIALCLSAMLCAQDNYKLGYVITNQNDTITGWINLRTDKNNQKQCEFKSDLSLPTKIYLPGDIAGYRFTDEGKYYVSREIQINATPQKVFLEFLVKGIMNLYYYEDEAKYYFFENQDGKMEVISQKPERVENLTYIEDNSYIGKIRYLFRDYQPIAQNANKLEFNQKSMINVVKEYHDEVCTTGESCIIFQNEHPDDKGVRCKISVYGGLQISNYVFTYQHTATQPGDAGYKSTQIGGNVSPVLGAQINLMNPRWSKSFSIQFDVSLSQFKGDMPDKIIRYVGNGIKDDVPDDVKQYTTEYGKVTSYKAMASSLRLGVKYIYPKYRISPTVEAGVAYTHLGGKVVKYDMLRSYLLGYYLGLGADYRIKTSQAIFIRLVYEDYPFSDSLQLYGNDKINMLQAKLGFTF